MEQTWFGISNKVVYSIIAVILLLWGLSGLQEITKTAYAGYFTSPDRVVTTVREGSPAEGAGLRSGDQITKLDGIVVEDVAALAARARFAVGSIERITVQREGQEQTLSLQYGERPAFDIWLNEGAGILVGLAALLLGLLVYLRHPTLRSSMLCLLLLSLAALFLPIPYLHSATARGWMFALLSLISALFVGLLLLYCLKFPITKRVLKERPWLGGVIFGVALLLGLITAYLNIAAPTLSNSASLTLSLMIGLLYGAMFFCALLAILHSYFKADALGRKAWGLNWMMLGVVLGLAPVVLVILSNLLFPRLGETFLSQIVGFTFLAVPIGFALALMKREPVRHAIGEEARA